MWKYHKFSKVIRVIVSIVIIFIFGCLLFGDDDSDMDYSRPLGDYDTDITYYDLARNPDDYKDHLLVMEGTVVQTVESDEDEEKISQWIDGMFFNWLCCNWMWIKEESCYSDKTNQ